MYQKGELSNKSYIKLCFLGMEKVGKTQVLNRLSPDFKEFQEDYIPTSGVNYKSFHKLSYDGQEKIIQIWDAFGHDKFRKIVEAHAENSYGVLVFDITNKASYLKLENYIGIPKCEHLILIGNKSDLKNKREVSFKEAKTFAEKNNMQYFEVSAKNNNIEYPDVSGGNDQGFDEILDYIIYQDEVLNPKKQNISYKMDLKTDNTTDSLCFDFILNVFINLANVVTLFGPYILISNCITHKKHYEENKNIRGSYFAFYGESINKMPPEYENYYQYT